MTSTSKIILGVVGAAAVGVAIGMLLAPEKGADIKNEPDPNPNIAELAADYVETYYKLTVVNINQKIADISAVASFSMIGAIIGCFVGLLLSIAGSLWLGSLLGSTALGFLAMA